MTRSECLVPSCRMLAPVGRLLCPSCWSRVPQAIRDRLYWASRPGQQEGLVEPSPEWIAAAREAIEAAVRPADLGAGWRLAEVGK